MDLLLGAPGQILEEVDGDVLVPREVGQAIQGQEEVDLALAPVLGGEFSRAHLHRRIRVLAWLLDDLVHLVIHFKLQL